MLDKSNTIHAIIQVLKKEILPNLSNDMAKEQAVALLSVLKNLDANTVQNEEIYRNVNIYLTQQLSESLQTLHQTAAEPLKSELTSFQERFTAILQEANGDKKKWESLNQLFSELIHFVYRNRTLHPYIPELRKIIRGQLNMEITFVH